MMILISSRGSFMAMPQQPQIRTYRLGPFQPIKNRAVSDGSTPEVTTIF